MGNYNNICLVFFFFGYICILPSHVATTILASEGLLHDRGEV